MKETVRIISTKAGTTKKFEQLMETIHVYLAGGVTEETELDADAESSSKSSVRTYTPSIVPKNSF
jgi:hypothetical protein